MRTGFGWLVAIALVATSCTFSLGSDDDTAIETGGSTDQLGSEQAEVTPEPGDVEEPAETEEPAPGEADDPSETDEPTEADDQGETDDPAPAGGESGASSLVSTADDDLTRAFEAYVADPSQANFLTARTALLDSTAYSPYSTDFATINKLIDDGDFTGALDALRGTMPNLILSPRAYFAAAFAYEQLGQAADADRERAIGRLAADGILGTGDGSMTSPYLVLRVDDEYDIVNYLGIEGAPEQSLENIDGRNADVLSFEDGTKLYFDVADFLG